MTVERPLCRLLELTSQTDPSVAQVLSDLNLFYIRQIGASLRKHVGLQDRLEREIRIRDGSLRLMAQCTHEEQLLEAAKSLRTSNARTFAYMGQLQKMKAAEVMDAVMDEPGFSGDSKVCAGRIAISDIRIPLVWKEIFASNKSKDNARHAVFCLLTMGSEVQDTELVCVDKTTTDISFSDIIVFENAAHGFHVYVELLCCPISANYVSAPTPNKLIHKLSKRSRERSNSAGSNKFGPQYEKVASLTLTLDHVGDAVRSHDLDKVTDTEVKLPLYENLSFRLVAQPRCITHPCVTGFLNYLEMIGSVPSWTYVWCEVKAGFVKGWKNPEDCGQKDPHFTIDLLLKDVKVNEIEKSRQKRPHSFQVRDLTERNIFAATDKQALIEWIRGLRQHKHDHAAWSAACCDVRKPMFIASPSPRNLPSDLLFERGVRKTLVYQQLGMDSPIRAMTEAVKCSDMLRHNGDDHMTSSVQTMLMENQGTAPWAGFFTGGSTKPPKVTKINDIQACHSRALETSGSDDAFLSDSDDNNAAGNSPQTSSKKKRRAPLPPKDKPPRPTHRNTPPPKPPLPKIMPRICTRSSLSSASSLDDILEEQPRSSALRPRHPRRKPTDKPRGVADGGEGGIPLGGRVWEKKHNRVIPPTTRGRTERSQSLDVVGGASGVLPSSVGEGRPRTNTLPSVSPSKRSADEYNTAEGYKTAEGYAAPRKSYLSAVESNKLLTTRDVTPIKRDVIPSMCDVTYRQLTFDAGSRVFVQKPPALPPKLRGTPKENRPEPIYAKVDRKKKMEDRRRKEQSEPLCDVIQRETVSRV